MKAMIRLCHLLLALFTLAGTGPALAEPSDDLSGPILVELFASQNCKACPKAHQTMRDVAASREDVLILTWSVDYWDYLGEADPMALPQATARQAAYAERFGLRGPYTPQTVYNGGYQCPGNRPGDVGQALEKAAASAGADVAFQRSEDGIRLDVPDAVAGELLLIRFLERAEHDTSMVHPVTGMDRVDLNASGEIDLASLDCPYHCALVFQAPGHGRVHAALKVK